MDKLERNIERARGLLDYRHYDGQFDAIYPFSNENFKEVLSYFDVRDKDCLMVQGSGDQILDVHLHGAKSITSFDVNPETEPYMYLKQAAMLAGLSHRQFLDFFCYKNYRNHKENLHAFDKKMFNEIRKYFTDVDSETLWATLYDDAKNLKSENSGLSIRQPLALFNDDEYRYNVLQQTVDYLNPRKYKQLQKVIGDLKVDFIPTNLHSLYGHLIKTYDFMYFSNIAQYLGLMFKNTKDPLTRLRNFRQVINYLSEYLNKDGYMVLGYLYSLNSKDLTIANPEIRKELFPSPQYQELYVRSMHSIDAKLNFNTNCIDQDMCLVYKKIS